MSLLFLLPMLLLYTHCSFRRWNVSKLYNFSANSLDVTYSHWIFGNLSVTAAGRRQPAPYVHAGKLYEFPQHCAMLEAGNLALWKSRGFSRQRARWDTICQGYFYPSGKSLNSYQFNSVILVYVGSADPRVPAASSQKLQFFIMKSVSLCAFT